MRTTLARLSRLEHRVTATVIVVMLMAALGIVGVTAGVREGASAEAMEVHTLEVIGNIDAVLTLSIDLETGMRGFLFTGIESYLKPYNDARAALPGTLDSLGALVRDNRTQAARLRELRTAVSKQLMVRSEVLRRAGSQGLAAGREMAITSGSKESMDALREAVKQMRAEEARLLRVRRLESLRLDRWLFGSLALFATLTIVALGSSGFQILAFLRARMRAEQAASESAENLAVTLRSIGDGVLATDLESRITWLNPVAERLTGWSQAEARGKSIHDVFRIINEYSRKPVEIPVAEVLRTGSVVGLANHTVLLSRTGEEIPIDDSATPIRDSEARLLGAVLVFRDVTVERRAAMKLRASEELNRGVTEMAPYTLLTQVDGRIQWLNPAGREMFRGDNEALAGKPLLDLVAPEFRDAARAWILRLNTDGLPAPPTEARFLRTDRTTFWGRVAASPTIANGQAGAVVIVEDITSRKEAEARAAAREVQLRAISDNLPEGAVFQFLTNNEVARFTYLSSGIQALTELAPDELLLDYRPILGLFMDDEEADFNRAARTASLDLLPFDHTLRIRTASGIFRWLQCRAAATRRPDGAVQWDGIVTDVSAARQIRQELSLLNVELEQRVQTRVREIRRFRAAVDNSADSVFLLDRAAMRFVDVNSTACRVLGYSREELLSLGPGDIHPEDPESLARKIDRNAADENLAALETTCRRRDGTAFPVDVSIRPLDGEDAGILIAIARDTSAHRAVIDSLRSREMQLNAAQSMAHIGSWEWNAETEATYWSPELCSIYGVAPGMPPPLSEEVPRFYAPDAWARLEEAFRQTVLTGTPYVLEAEVVRDDGTRRWTVSRGARVDGPGPLRLFGTIQDVTERRYLENQLQQAQKMEAIGRLAGGVAHDFNNLLTVINGYSDMLLAKLTPGDTVFQKVSYIRKAGLHATELTQQLLAFSRKQIVQPRQLDLNDVVREFEPMLRRVMGEHIDITTRLAPDLGLVLADPGQLGQVLMNLAANAGSAMPDGGCFRIETTNSELTEAYSSKRPEVVPGCFVQLTVSDTGVGMDDETKAHLFEPFFTTHEAGKGTGLGLATVYGIVKQAGGFIWVYSEPGEGTTLKIYLPRTSAELAEVRKSSQPQTEGGSETILLVEDQDDLRNLAAEILRELGYKVLMAPNGALALEEASRYKKSIDLLLTDVVMPGLSVRELVEAVKGYHPDIRVVFMSGYTEDAVIRRGISEAHNAFIQKPFSPHVLAARVRETLNS